MRGARGRLLTTYVALLRGINVGTKRLAMAELRAMLAGLGLADVRTLLQSGNAVFRTAPNAAAELERTLEAETRRRFGHEVGYFVRDPAQLNEALASNPFPAEAAAFPARTVATFLRDVPSAAAVDALQRSLAGPELVRARGAVLYAHYPIDIGNSKLTLAAIERAFGTRGTARNWNTLLKLAALVRT